MILCLIPFRIRFVLIVIVPLDWRFLYSEVLILRQKYKIQIRISEIQELTAFRDSKSGSFLSKIPGITEYKVIFVFLIKTRYTIKFTYAFQSKCWNCTFGVCSRKSRTKGVIQKGCIYSRTYNISNMFVNIRKKRISFVSKSSVIDYQLYLVQYIRYRMNIVVINMRRLSWYIIIHQQNRW